MAGGVAWPGLRDHCEVGMWERHVMKGQDQKLAAGLVPPPSEARGVADKHAQRGGYLWCPRTAGPSIRPAFSSCPDEGHVPGGRLRSAILNTSALLTGAL